MGTVSALRETSVLFVALISTFVLKESVGVYRLVAAAWVCAGIVLIRLQPRGRRSAFPAPDERSTPPNGPL